MTLIHGDQLAPTARVYFGDVLATGVVWLSTYDPQVQTDIWTQAADTNLIEGSYVRVSDDGRQEWSWRLERANPE